jgi:hypothetical protein
MGPRLVLTLRGQPRVYEARLEAGVLHLLGPGFPDGLELARPGSPAARRLLAPWPDEETRSPDRPRLRSPDGRASFIVPAGFHAEWYERPGFGELVLSVPSQPLLRLRARIGALDELDREKAPKEVLALLACALQPDLPLPRPAAAPQHGRLGRWPARSVEIEATASDGRLLRGWTAVALARPWYAHVAALGPVEAAESTIRLARQVFHDLRLRPGERSRELELRLCGHWRPDPDAAEQGLDFWPSGDFRWLRPDTEILGRYQVRGRALLLTWGDAEKQLDLRWIQTEGAARIVELSGWRLQRLGPAATE